MARPRRTVGTIKCQAALNTINTIAESCGLRAERGGPPDHFNLVNSGRNPASEVEPELLAAAISELDRAVERGQIPQWLRADITPVPHVALFGAMTAFTSIV